MEFYEKELSDFKYLSAQGKNPIEKEQIKWMKSEETGVISGGRRHTAFPRAGRLLVK